MKTQIKLLIGCLFLSVFTSCETVELDLQEDPNQLSVDASDPDLILNSIQLRFAQSVWADFNGTDMALVRMINQRDTYANNIDGLTLQFTPFGWTNAYRIFNDVDAISDISSEENPLPFHEGMAKFFKAYTMITLVDHMGDIVFSEGNNPEEFPLPGLDSGEEVYDAAFALLEEAEVHFETETVVVPNDLFYNGDASKWIKAVNTLKLKMYITTRLVSQSESTAGINAIIASGEYINSPSEALIFRYSSTASPVESRHPAYVANYGASFASAYMSNDLLHLLKEEKFNTDPRLRYYIYRQTPNAPSGALLPCAQFPTQYNYCYVGDLYWGRDHKDDEGIPNDAASRSTFGIYPVGGAYDDGVPGEPSTFQNVANNAGLGGAGILPYWLSSFTSFTLAEAALTLGTTGEPVELLEEGIRRSFTRIENFSGIPMAQADKEAYITEVLENYAAASSQEAKLKIIMTEYYLALFGNGVEAYNTYRRTGYPDFPKGVLLPDEAFPRRYLFPDSETSTNPNIEQNDRTDTVFWDTLPASELN